MNVETPLTEARLRLLQDAASTVVLVADRMIATSQAGDLASVSKRDMDALGRAIGRLSSTLTAIGAAP